MLLGWLRPVPDFSVRQDVHASHQRSVGLLDGERSRGFSRDGFDLYKRHRKDNFLTSMSGASCAITLTVTEHIYRVAMRERANAASRRSVGVGSSLATAAY